ncbi:ABC transporter substrate-binding protein [Dictyobacter aurantiacus]|uniref:Sugar ABC transporter substrate-binding protein n=1 Tax=Dictyobacter aurantiacus TaxID=1936993 RepID=A0A401ZPA2_9CHLR|nr:extracellular solute-binding protein [Dictyobacter aurantiacus]GCE08640.1 sugar ABC transporter substrate-binding protein [Dictyobacter aurantiacus]
MNRSPRKVAISTASIVCLLSLFAVMLSACAGPGSNPKIQLTLWYWNRSIDDSLIQQVGKVFPNIDLQAEKITDYDSKVRTSMAGHHGVPDILGINSNISTYFPDEDQFVDLRTLGADSIKSQYLDWKWNLGVAPGGKLIALPMDTGPTALFYREDLFAKAGLPTDPQQVTDQLKTWDDYIQAGVKMKQATNGKVFMFDNINNVFSQAVGQHALQYFDRSNKYIGTQDSVKQAWTLANKVNQAGISANISNWTTEWNAGVSNGTIASFVGAVWMKQVLQDAAPNTKGKWRIARNPGGDGNSGGSFLAVTKASAHPKEAFEVVKWLENPANQLTAYKSLQLFPSTISTLDQPGMSAKEDFYGGQDTNQIFSVAAKDIPRFYFNEYSDIVGGAYSDQLSLIALQGKKSDQAWNDAQTEIQRQLLR